jgi:hypothetical protein
MSRVRLCPILPNDMDMFARALMAYPEPQRRAECRRILDAVMAGAAVHNRGLRLPLGMDSNLCAALFRERDAQRARGWTLRQWSDDPHEHMICMAMACEMAADVMRAESVTEEAA